MDGIGEVESKEGFCVKVEAVQGKQVSLEWTETSGGLWECVTTLEFLSPFLCRDLWNVKRREIPEQGRLGNGALVAN